MVKQNIIISKDLHPYVLIRFNSNLGVCPKALQNNCLLTILPPLKPYQHSTNKKTFVIWEFPSPGHLERGWCLSSFVSSCLQEYLLQFAEEKKYYRLTYSTKNHTTFYNLKWLCKTQMFLPAETTYYHFSQIPLFYFFYYCCLSIEFIFHQSNV